MLSPRSYLSLLGAIWQAGPPLRGEYVYRYADLSDGVNCRLRGFQSVGVQRPEQSSGVQTASCFITQCTVDNSSSPNGDSKPSTSRHPVETRAGVRVFCSRKASVL